MANLSIKYSQEVVNFLELESSEEIGVSGVLDTVLTAQYAIGQYYIYFEDYSYDGSTLELYFSDGSTATYSNVVLSNPNASSGTAIVDSYQLVVPGEFVIQVDGELDYDYVTSGDFLSLRNTAATINNYAIFTIQPSYAADPLLGNVALGVGGNLNISENGQISGSLSAIAAGAEKLLNLAVWEGDFAVSGDLEAIANGYGESFVEGMLHRIVEDYEDGSYVLFEADPAGLFLADDQDPYVLFKNPQNFPENDVFSLDLPAELSEYLVFYTGDGEDEIFVSGGYGKVGISAGAGNDEIVGGSLGHAIDGGNGLDTIYYGENFADYSISYSAISGKITLTLGGRSDQVTNIESFSFADQSFTADSLISALPNYSPQGSLFLYGAGEVGSVLLAETRGISDSNGLGDFSYQWYRNGELIDHETSNTYLLSGLDDGQLITVSASYQDGGGNFEVISSESRLISDPTSLSYSELIEMYVIILGRAPAQGGLDFWSGFINQGKDFEYIAGEMWSSAGAREFYPSNMSTEEVVTSVYTNILVREPKEAGLNFWVGRWEEVGPVKTMLEMIGALTANNSSDPLAIADKVLFQSKVDIGGYLANTVQNTDVDLASTAFDYLEVGYTVEQTKDFIDTEMGIIGQSPEFGGDDLFA